MSYTHPLSLIHLAYISFWGGMPFLVELRVEALLFVGGGVALLYSEWGKYIKNESWKKKKIILAFFFLNIAFSFILLVNGFLYVISSLGLFLSWMSFASKNIAVKTREK